MASINELPPDQLAVLRLLLGQGSSYEAIAGSLHIEDREVRSRAAAALDSLASTAPPPTAERDAATDYLLGQQDAAAQDATRAMLASSAAALAWARSLREPLGEIASGDLPRLPDASAGAPRVAEDDAGMAPAASAAAAAPAAGERRYGRILLAALAGLVILFAGLLIGRLTAPDGQGENSPATNASQRDGNATPVAAARLKPPPGAPAPKALGIAQFAREQGRVVLGVAAQGMPKAPRDPGTEYG